MFFNEIEALVVERLIGKKSKKKGERKNIFHFRRGILILEVFKENKKDYLILNGVGG